MKTFWKHGVTFSEATSSFHSTPVFTDEWGVLQMLSSEII